ncbi:MAG: hypothetical protein Q4D61_08695 [Cardiobacteriaceae bacterium]|nr:hypothetical protein [Cardiobacteriaceae bacterium]
MSDVLRVADIDEAALRGLLAAYGLRVEMLPDGADIPGSYWGAPEAGLIGNCLYLRPDTPVHSALHEGGHWICMDDARRQSVHTDAKGSVMEECAVNYLQILLAEALPDVGRERMLDDMTAWGYSYREGNVRNWLKGDGLDARDWLVARGLLAANGERRII